MLLKYWQKRLMRTIFEQNVTKKRFTKDLFNFWYIYFETWKFLFLWDAFHLQLFSQTRYSLKNERKFDFSFQKSMFSNPYFETISTAIWRKIFYRKGIFESTCTKKDSLFPPSLWSSIQVCDSKNQATFI